MLQLMCRLVSLHAIVVGADVTGSAASRAASLLDTQAAAGLAPRLALRGSAAEPAVRRLLNIVRRNPVPNGRELTYIAPEDNIQYTAEILPPSGAVMAIVGLYLHKHDVDRIWQENLKMRGETEKDTLIYAALSLFPTTFNRTLDIGITMLFFGAFLGIGGAFLYTRCFLQRNIGRSWAKLVGLQIFLYFGLLLTPIGALVGLIGLYNRPLTDKSSLLPLQPSALVDAETQEEDVPEEGGVDETDGKKTDVVSADVEDTQDVSKSAEAPEVVSESMSRAVSMIYAGLLTTMAGYLPFLFLLTQFHVTTGFFVMEYSLSKGFVRACNSWANCVRLVEMGAELVTKVVGDYFAGSNNWHESFSSQEAATTTIKNLVQKAQSAAPKLSLREIQLELRKILIPLLQAIANHPGLTFIEKHLKEMEEMETNRE